MNKKYATYMICFVIMVFAMNMTMISPLLLEIARSFSIGLAEAGTIFTAQFIGFIIFTFVGGILADKYGKKSVTVFSIVGLLVAVTIFPFSSNFITACIVITFIGGFGGIIESVATSLVSDTNQTNNSFYVNMSQVFFGIGALLGPIFAGIIISNRISWKFCYYIVDVLLFVVLMLFTTAKMTEPQNRNVIKLKDIKVLFTDKKFMLICACMFLYTGAEVGGWGWLSTFMQKVMNFSVLKASISVAVFWAFMAIGRIFCGRLTLKFKLSNIIMVLALSSGLVTLLATFVFSELLIWVVVALMGLTYSSQWPLIASYGSKYSIAPSGTVFSILISAGGLGCMIVPFVMGVIGESLDLRFAMLVPAGLLLLVGLTFIFFKHGEKFNEKKEINYE